MGMGMGMADHDYGGKAHRGSVREIKVVGSMNERSSRERR
jgi:hypothetical protein